MDVQPVTAPHVKVHYVPTKKDSKTKTCILLLLKYPEEGYVKSRLAKQIRGTIVVELYRNFIFDILSMLKNTTLPIIILYSPPNAQKKFERMLGTHYEYIPQKGNNLGERLKNGFTHVYNKAWINAIALASDIPDRSEDIVLEACATVKNKDVVIGPSPDGGYYLIGFKRTTFFPEIFDKIAWSTNTVFQKTIERVKKA